MQIIKSAFLASLALSANAIPIDDRQFPPSPFGPGAPAPPPGFGPAPPGFGPPGPPPSPFAPAPPSPPPSPFAPAPPPSPFSPPPPTNPGSGSGQNRQVYYCVSGNTGQANTNQNICRQAGGQSLGNGACCVSTSDSFTQSQLQDGCSDNGGQVQATGGAC